MLFIVMNSSLLVSNIGSGGVGGYGVPIPVMSLLIVSKIACQRIFMLSDSGVPRTFVADRRSVRAYKSFKCMIFHNFICTGNNSYLRQKDTKEIIISHKRTRMVKDGED